MLGGITKSRGCCHLNWLSPGTPGPSDWFLFPHNRNFVSGGHLKQPTSELKTHASNTWKSSLGLVKINYTQLLATVIIEGISISANC